VSLEDGDLAAWFADELEQLRGAHPSRQLELEVIGDTRGRWEGARLEQVLPNLVTNALKYGSAYSPVHVVLIGEEAEVRLEVTNRGSDTEEAPLDGRFGPLARGRAQGGA